MKKIYGKIILFLLSIIFFAFIYKSYIPDLSFSDCIYISTTTQSLTGNTIVEKYEVAKKITIVQIIISYTIIVLFVYLLSKEYNIQSRI